MKICAQMKICVQRDMYKGNLYTNDNTIGYLLANQVDAQISLFAVSIGTGNWQNYSSTINFSPVD